MDPKGIDPRFRIYRRKSLTFARPYEPGEDLSAVSVSKEDTPDNGGLIAMNPDNPKDQWFINAEYAAKNLEEI